MSSVWMVHQLTMGTVDRDKKGVRERERQEKEGEEVKKLRGVWAGPGSPHVPATVRGHRGTDRGSVGGKGVPKKAYMNNTGCCQW